MFLGQKAAQAASAVSKGTTINEWHWGFTLPRKTTLKIKMFKKFHYKKLASKSSILHRKINSERFHLFLMLKNDFESTNFVIFEEVVHNFGRSEGDMI